MPTINLNKWVLQSLTKLNEQELQDFLFRLKSEVSPINQDDYSIEVNADRLDMLSLGGIVRAIKGISDQEIGEPKYKTSETDYVLEVDRVPSRPYALACVIKNAKLSPEFYLKELIQFQEKLHDTIGRRRKKVAIGIHDLKKVEGKIIKYTLVPLSTTFVPLNQQTEMTVGQTLKETQQGKAYGGISVFNGQSPAIMDEKGILSLPPVINSDRTKISVETDSLLIDVTGTNFDSVVQTMDLIATGMAELGAEIGIVKIKGMDSEFSPLMKHTEVIANLNDIMNRLGISINGDDVIKLLRRMRMEAELQDDKIKVTVPPYRVDIMNYTDIAEDIAMAYGYDNFQLNSAITRGQGSLSENSLLYRKLRSLLIGAGYTEVYTLILTKSGNQRGDFVQIRNPISVEYDSVRNSLVWSALAFLSNNQHSRFPIKIFEIGDVVIKDDKSDTLHSNEPRLVVAMMDSRVSYEMIQAPLHEVLFNLTGITPSYIKSENELLIKGRSAEISLKGKKNWEL